MEIQEKAVPLYPVISFSVINYVVSYEESHGSGTNLICFREHRSDVSLLFYIPLSWRDIRNEIAVLFKKHKT